MEANVSIAPIIPKGIILSGKIIFLCISIIPSTFIDMFSKNPAISTEVVVVALKPIYMVSEDLKSYGPVCTIFDVRWHRFESLFV